MQNPYREPNYPDDRTDSVRGSQADTTAFGSPYGDGQADNGQGADAETAGHAELHESLSSETAHFGMHSGSGQKTGDVTAILEEIELKRRLHEQEELSSAAASYAEPSEQAEIVTRSEPSERRSGTKSNPGRKKPSPAYTKSGTESVSGTKRKSASGAKTMKGKRKKKKDNFIVQVLKYIFPWRGDSIGESVRKIVFFTALTVVGVCAYLIGDYQLMLYRSKKLYDDIQQRLEETLNNRGFKETSYITDPVTGTEIEYLEENYLADKLLSANPDLVGYISIEGTEVSYPVVQKKSHDLNYNTNDYYLYRSFTQEESKAGCIFMDYRCHFDEVLGHRRVVENSQNLLIYGHNMNNRSMFGSLKDYVRNYGFLKEHPIVHLQSLYKDYDYKIFAAFIVDSADTDSEYAFDCWNTFDFEDEDDFYEFVNAAKKRTIITTDVDVTYGDPLLTLYTCNSMFKEGKLILMCRLMRPGEDPYEGVENAAHNENILWPKAYYSNHDLTFDPKLFVPYGPKENS